jgi:hypothetical protein
LGRPGYEFIQHKLIILIAEAIETHTEELSGNYITYPASNDEPSQFIREYQSGKRRFLRGPLIKKRG